MKKISSKKWGMTKPKSKFVKHNPIGIIIHHMGASSGIALIPHFKGITNIRSIDKHHTNPKSKGGNNWNAIGYHYIITPNGYIYLGRPDNVVGAHTGRHNTGNIGILVYGNMGVEKPTWQQIKTLTNLCKELVKKYPKIKSIKGHKDFTNTSCPGTNLYDRLGDISHDVFKVTELKKVTGLDFANGVDMTGVTIISKTGHVEDTRIYSNGVLMTNVSRIQIDIDAITGKTKTELTLVNPSICLNSLKLKE